MLTHDIVGKHAVATCAEMRLDGCDVWAHVAPMFHLVDAFAVYAVTLVVRRHPTHVLLACCICVAAFVLFIFTSYFLNETPLRV